jgi:hypothetical protein
MFRDGVGFIDGPARTDETGHKCSGYKRQTLPQDVPCRFSVRWNNANRMGFGSYDESERENQADDADIDEDEAVTVHENDHDGEVTVEGADSTGELVDRLQDLK